MSLTKFSTSLGEAFLAGQCIGYESLHRVNIHKSCIEFIEQKKALLSSLSTSLKEATLSGMCVGAIYRIVEECTTRYNYINYLDIAENAYSIGYVQDYLNCNGNKYDW